MIVIMSNNFPYQNYLGRVNWSFHVFFWGGALSNRHTRKNGRSELLKIYLLILLMSVNDVKLY